MKMKRTVSALIVLSALLIVPPSGFGQGVIEINEKIIAVDHLAEIDASGAKDGYVTVRYLKKTDKALRVIIESPEKTPYIYRLEPGGKCEVFPFSEGNGHYNITVYEKVTGNKYSAVLKTSRSVWLSDEFAPFTRPNQYVDYSDNGKTAKMAANLTKNSKNTTDKIAAIYDYIINNISYDKQLANTVQSGYLPDVDEILKNGKGICFDYAAVMTAMLRSQHIPAKLVVGYRGKDYHAWVSVYPGESGWVDGTTYFDGKHWELMDPSFAAYAGSNSEILKYMRESGFYSAKYYY